MNDELKEIFLKAIDGDNEAVEYMVNKFRPKLYHYAKKLKYAEAKTDMTITMLEFIKKTRPQQIIDRDTGEIVNFILLSLQNGYKDHMKKYLNNKVEVISIDPDTIPVYARYNNLEKQNIDMILKGLTDNQREVIIARYVKLYSKTEVARMMRKTRQAIINLEQRALQIMRKNYDINAY